LPALSEVDHCANSARYWAKGRPVVRRQYDKRDLSLSKVLLMPDILVACDEHIEPSLFGCRKKLAIVK